MSKDQCLPCGSQQQNVDKLKKDQLKGRVQAAKAQQELQQASNGLGTSGAMATFERMEEKVLQ